MRTLGARSWPISPAGRRWLGVGLAVVGFALLAQTLLSHGIEGDGGGGGFDAIAYWTAGRHVIDGASLYGLASGSFTAYLYPPVFAQLIAPLSLLPLPAFVWLWRLFELIGLRIAVGSWTRTGWALLVFPPILAELDAANVHLLMAGVTALAMRGTAWPIVPATLLKFASVPLVPLGWQLHRRELLLGLLATAGVIGVSAVASWSAWVEYLQFLGTTTFAHGWYNVAEAVPVPLRLVAAAAAGFAALRWRRLAPIAVLLAYPIVWLHSLSTLAAVVTPLPERVAARGATAAAPPDARRPATALASQ